MSVPGMVPSFCCHQGDHEGMSTICVIGEQKREGGCPCWRPCTEGGIILSVTTDLQMEFRRLFFNLRALIDIGEPKQ